MYNITVNKEQLEKIVEALEFYSRFICGQINLSTIPKATYKMLSEKGFDSMTGVDLLFASLKAAGWDGKQRGIGFNRDADLAYEMYAVMKHKIREEDRGEPALPHSANDFMPLLSTGVPFIKMEKIEK